MLFHFTVEQCDMSYHILKLEYCFDLPPIVVCSGRSIPWILSFPLYSIFLRPIVCSHWDIANVTLFCICNGPHYPLHCVQYYPCFVRKCAKYQHINTAPSVRNITTVHKFTSPWEPSDICVGGVVGNSKGIARVFVTRGREGKGGLQWKCETWDIGG